MGWFNFHFHTNINVETTSGHQYWIVVILQMVFQSCFVNVETTPINMSQLNFHFQPNFNVETTLFFFWHWINVILWVDLALTLFCQRWNNVGKCRSAKLLFSTKYQCYNNVDERWQSMLFQSSLIQRWYVYWVRNLKKVSDGQSIIFIWIFHWRLMAWYWDFHVKKKTSKDVWFQIFEIFL